MRESLKNISHRTHATTTNFACPVIWPNEYFQAMNHNLHRERKWMENQRTRNKKQKKRKKVVMLKIVKSEHINEAERVGGN